MQSETTGQRDLADIARGVRRALAELTRYNVWFDNQDAPLVPRVSETQDVFGSFQRVRMTMAPHGPRFASGGIANREAWWDVEVNTREAGKWNLTVTAPRQTFPGWGYHREVVSGSMSDTDEIIREHVQYAAGPLDCLTEKWRKPWKR